MFRALLIAACLGGTVGINTALAEYIGTYDGWKVQLWEDGRPAKIKSTFWASENPCSFAETIGWRITLEGPECLTGCGDIGVNFSDNTIDEDEVRLQIGSTNEKCPSVEDEKALFLPKGCSFTFPLRVTIEHAKNEIDTYITECRCTAESRFLSSQSLSCEAKRPNPFL